MQEERPEPFLIEDEQVIQALTQFEWDIECHTGVRKISGGFASTDIYYADDENYFDVQLKWGVQSDCENTVHTEQYTMDRLTLLIKDA